MGEALPKLGRPWALVATMLSVGCGPGEPGGTPPPDLALGKADSAVHHDSSPPLRDLAPAAAPPAREHWARPVPPPGSAAAADPVVQTGTPARDAPTAA